MTTPTDSTPVLEPTDPERSHKIAWRTLGAVALAPHVFLFSFMLYL